MDPDDVWENDGEVLVTAEEPAGCEPVIFRFFGECWYSDRRWELAFCEYGDSCVDFVEGVGGSLDAFCEVGGTQ